MSIKSYLSDFCLIKEFKNTKEDWIAFLLYILLAPFVVVIGSVIFVATFVCVAFYLLIDYTIKAAKYFIPVVKNLINKIY